MDVMELKLAWGVLQQEVVDRDRVDEETITAMLHRKSGSEISKIKRGLYLKFIIASLAILAAVALALLSVYNGAPGPLDAIFSPVESASLFSVLALSVSIMVYFNFKAYLQIKAIQSSSLNLRDNLRAFIGTMERAIAFNIFSDTFMTPVVTAWAYYAYAFQDHDPGLDLRTVMLVLLPILIGPVSYFSQRYLQQLKFGQYLAQLKAYLLELEKNPTEL